MRVSVEFNEAYSNSTYSGVVTGPAAQPFSSAVQDAFPYGPQGQRYFIVLTSPDTSDRDLLIVDKSVTLGDVFALFGDEPIRIDNGGRGGGGFWNTVPEVLAAASKLSGPVRATLSLFAISLSVRYREERGEIKDWDDTGSVSKNLEQMVLSHNPWTRRVFDRTFGLSRDRGGELLRSLGYYRSGIDETNEEHWTRDDPDPIYPR